MAGNFYAHSMYPYTGGDHHQPPQQPPPHHSGWGSGQIGFLSYGNAPEHHPTQSYIAEHMYPPPPPQHHHTYTNYSPFFSNPQQQQHTPPPYPPPPPHQPIPDAFWANTNNVMHQMEPAPVQLETSKVESSGIKSYNSSNTNDVKQNSGASKARQMSWATIASQPVKAPPKSIKSKLATAVLSATKPMPNTLAPSSSSPSSASEDQENKSSDDAQNCNSNNHTFDSNGSRDRPMQPTPEPTPAQAAEIIERQKKEQLQQNREQANLKNKASKNIDSKSNVNVSADRLESNQLSSKSSLNSSINSHRSNRDDTPSSQQRDKPNNDVQREIGISDVYRNDNNQTLNSKEISNDNRDLTYRRDARDYSSQNARDHYYRDNRDSRNLHRNQQNNNQRDFYLRNDPINRRSDQNNRWEQQSTGRDSSRDRRDNRDFDNRTDHRDYSRDIRRDAYSNRNGSGRFSDVSSNHSNSAYNSRGNGSSYGSNYGSGQNHGHAHHQSHSNHHLHHQLQGQGGYPYNKNHQPNSSRPTNYNNNINNNNNNNKQINRPNATISKSNRQFNIPSRSSSTSLNNPSGRPLSKLNTHYSASSTLSHSYPPLTEHQQRANEQEAQSLLDKLRAENNYNPSTFDTPSRSSRFFIIKSYSEDDVHRSIKYSIWCSTEHGNAKLDAAYRSQETLGPVYLLYSVNGSGHFCGVAQMLSPVDYNACSGVWSQDKWKGQFRVKWIYVKDVPNQALKHIILANNDYKPVTYSRDTQEVPHAQGCEVLDIIHSYSHTTSIFDDFLHYEKKQLEEQHYRKMQQQQESNQGDALHSPPPSSSISSNNQNHYDQQSNYNSDRHHHYRSNLNRYNQSDRNRTLERPNKLISNSNNRSSIHQQANNDSSCNRESQSEQLSDKEQSNSISESVLNEKASTENDDTNNQESVDSSLAGACYKLSLESTIWADQWD